MTTITVSGAGGNYVVDVVEGSSASRHTVSVPPGLASVLGWEGREEDLVRASFSFLLEREPAAAILRRFGLDVIERYFPEYRAEIARRAAPG